MTTPEAPLLTVADVADRLAVSRQTVRRWIRQGDLPAVKLGSRRNASVRVAASAVRELTRSAS